jgi:hypothetical protein
MARPRKNDFQRVRLPPHFARDRDTREARVEYLLRQRIKQGPSALFDTKRHRLRYEPEEIFLALVRFQESLKRAGWEPTLSVDETKFMKRYGDHR